MLRRPSLSTLTVTLFTYTTLFRSSDRSGRWLPRRSCRAFGGLPGWPCRFLASPICRFAESVSVLVSFRLAHCEKGDVPHAFSTSSHRSQSAPSSGTSGSKRQQRPHLWYSEGLTQTPSPPGCMSTLATMKLSAHSVFSAHEIRPEE